MSVDLLCRVRLRECGNFYSIEWYREARRPPPARPPPPIPDPPAHGSRHGHYDELIMAASSKSAVSPAASSSERLYVYRHTTGVAKSEGAWRGRARHSYDSKRHVMRLSLDPTRLSDAGYYRYGSNFNLQCFCHS